MTTINAGEELKSLRDSIDDIDNTIIKLLSKRFEYTHQVGITKAQHNIPSISPEREEQQMTRVKLLASDNNVPTQVAQDIMRIIIDEVVRQHYQIKNLGNNQRWS